MTATKYDHWTNPAALADRLRTRTAELQAARAHDEAVRAFAEALSAPTHAAGQTRLAWSYAAQDGLIVEALEDARRDAEIGRSFREVIGHWQSGPDRWVWIQAVQQRREADYLAATRDRAIQEHRG
jgi:hypothetical protein